MLLEHRVDVAAVAAQHLGDAAARFIIEHGRAAGAIGAQALVIRVAQAALGRDIIGIAFEFPAKIEPLILSRD